MPKANTRTLNLKPTVRKKRSVQKKTPSIIKSEQDPVHSWRVYPYGEHWVRTHPMHVPPSQVNPDRSITTRHEHCAKNPSGKDQLYPEEIQEIMRKHFSKLKNKPGPLPLIFGVDGSKYDDFIAGWTQYWNDVLKPDESLDPNLVKALIASESGFAQDAMANKKNSNSARGLMRITNQSRQLLGGDHDELKDPNINICAGVRWLFEKRRLLSSRLKRPATWIETVWDYKAINLAKTKKKANDMKNKFNGFYEELQKCKKP